MAAGDEPMKTTKEKIDDLKPIFINAAIGEFSQDVVIPQEEDEMTPVYVGTQIMLDIIREKNKALEAEIVKVHLLNQTKTEFVSMASHQMRAPLTTINLFSEMLTNLNKDGLTDVQKKYIEEMHKASKKMVTLSNSLVNISTLELNTFIPRIETFSLTELITTVIQTHKAEIERKQLSLTTNFAPELPQITAGMQFIRLIVQTLVSNAVAYTPDKGTITLKVTYDPQDATFLFTVTDTGYGIPEEEQDKMFSMFFRGSNIHEIAPEGNGLSMHIVKLIIDRIDGEISFHSKINEGATFSVKIPKSMPVNS
jgi:two-component system phosphate regulon sensor histidine kinase PhoR